MLNFVVLVFRRDHVYTFLSCMFLERNFWTVGVQLSTPIDAARQFSKVVVSTCVSSGTICEFWLLHSLMLNAIFDSSILCPKPISFSSQIISHLQAFSLGTALLQGP